MLCPGLRYPSNFLFPTRATHLEDIVFDNLRRQPTDLLKILADGEGLFGSIELIVSRWWRRVNSCRRDQQRTVESFGVSSKTFSIVAIGAVLAIIFTSTIVLHFSVAVIRATGTAAVIDVVIDDGPSPDVFRTQAVSATET